VMLGAYGLPRHGVWRGRLPSRILHPPASPSSTPDGTPANAIYGSVPVSTPVPSRVSPRVIPVNPAEVIQARTSSSV